MLRTRLFFPLFIFVFLFLLQPLTAAAFTIRPPRYAVTVDPGTSQTVVITVKNTDATTETFSFGVRGGSQDERGRTIWGTEVDAGEKWVAADIKTITLAPGASRNVTFTISVPVGSPAKFHMLGLMVEAQVPDQGTVSIRGQLITLLALQVGGRVEEALTVEQWAPLKIIVQTNDWPMQIGLHNVGSGPLPLAASVSVRSWSGKEIRRAPISLGNNLLPQSIRSLEPVISIPGASLRWPGRYLVQLTIAYGATHQQLVRTTFVWYLPLWSEILALVILIVALFSAWHTFKTKKVSSQ